MDFCHFCHRRGWLITLGMISYILLTAYFHRYGFALSQFCFVVVVVVHFPASNVPTTIC